MLACTTYDPAQIATARATFAEMASGWKTIAARSEAWAREAAEVQVFTQMVVALDEWFAHRPRRLDSRDSPAFAEVRLIAAGVTTNGGRFPNDTSTAWRPEISVTGLRPGDRIKITEPMFSKLSTAFLDGMTAPVSD